LTTYVKISNESGSKVNGLIKDLLFVSMEKNEHFALTLTVVGIPDRVEVQTGTNLLS
jgi:hypothetical protein